VDLVPADPAAPDDVTTVVAERHTHDALGGPVDRFDDAVDRLWGRVFRGRPGADRVFYLASELGDFSLVWHLIGAAQGLRSDRDADATFRLAAVLLTESLVVNQGIKRLVRRPRPQPTEPRPHHLRKPLTSSFPSGHASSAFTAAGVLSAHDPTLRPLYYAVAAVVATSRVHVQIHHASDVIAGAALGAVFARIAVRAWPAAHPLTPGVGRTPSSSPSSAAFAVREVRSMRATPAKRRRRRPGSAAQRGPARADQVLSAARRPETPAATRTCCPPPTRPTTPEVELGSNRG
jgi:membrane-associated phospholipid phosphatase